MNRHKFVKTSLLPSIFILLFSSSAAVSQRNASQELHYPKSFRLLSQKSGQVLSKTKFDTLQYHSFVKIKQDFVVNTGCGEYGSDQHQINIASDSVGGFMCAWNDDRAGDRQVNAQLFDNKGNRVGLMISVSDQDANWNSEPHIAYNRTSHEYIVLWAGSGYDIRFQRISASGELIGQNLTANQLYATNTNNPSAAVDSSGNIFVTWIADVSCCQTQIPYCRAFNKDGIPITDQWPLDVTGNANVSSIGWDDRIASDGSGRCVVVWSSYLNGHSRIVFQAVNLIGNLYSQPMLVSNPSDSSDLYFPTLTSTKDGHFLFLWGTTYGFSARILRADSGFVTAPSTLSSLPNYATTYVASSDNENRFFLTWFSDQGYGEIVSTDGQILKAATPLSFSTTIPWWSYPRLSKALFDRLFLVYGGYDRTQEDVMLQAFDTSFTAIGASVKAADDDCSAWQTNPVVGYNQFGASLVVWEDQRNGYHELYGQVLDASGTPVSANILISDPDTIQWISAPAVVHDREGNFLVSFAGGDYSTRNLVLQKVSSSGVLDGRNKWITAGYYYDYDQMKNVAQENDDGNIFLCWYPNVSSTIYAQQFNQDLASINAQLPIFTSSYQSPKYIIGVSTNKAFNTLVMWADYNYQTSTPGNTLKAMILDAGGNVIRDTLAVARIPDHWTLDQGACRIDDDSNLVFAWTEFDTTGYNFRMSMHRVYPSSNGTMADSFSINDIQTDVQIIKFDNRKALVSWNSYNEIHAIFFDDDACAYYPFNLHTFSPYTYSVWGAYNAYHADVFGDSLLMCYETMQNPDFGYDIYANIQRMNQLNFQPPPLLNDNNSSVYPNPTSQTVTLQYEITQQTKVTIAVYNILGQKIAEVENGIKAPGTYSARFQTRNLAAGIYFFAYHGLKSYTKKFIIIK
ncbi:MAG: T9SS type A sorting domain-containing protein [Bacteroidota bacterium]